MSEMQGVDLSHWNGAVDFGEAEQQTDFVIEKATQGVAEVDPRYHDNIAVLRRDHKLRGSYHYPNAGDPEDEADFYVHHAGRHDGEMQALDFEGAVLDIDDPVGWAAKWLDRVIRKTNNRPLIYMSGSVVTRFDWARVIALNVGLWVASWEAAPVRHIGQWPFVIMWQRDSDGRLPGIDGNVDQDVFFGDPALWRRYAHNLDDKPTHQPDPTPKPRPKPEPHHGSGHPGRHEYTVKAGDTLTEIANHHGVTVHELAAANEHRYPSLNWNPDLIQIGWHLTIPND